MNTSCCECDPDTGAPVLYEIKVPSATKATFYAGRGSAKNGGNSKSVGNIFGFGNTEEFYRHMVLGAKERGRPRDGPLNHDTGKGWVKAHPGQAADALKKRHRVIAAIVEASGGQTPQLRSHMGFLSRRVQGKNAIDRTKYGRTRVSTKSFYTHHQQQISKAATKYDASQIRAQITYAKQKIWAPTAA